MNGADSYPAARPERQETSAPRVAPRYEILESSPPLTCTNADALVIQFSGLPDGIDLSAHTWPAIFTFQDGMGVELGEVTVGPGVPYSSQVSARRVLARNAIAGSPAVAAAVGKWTRERAG
jgi:hypothetical protein